MGLRFARVAVLFFLLAAGLVPVAPAATLSLPGLELKLQGLEEALRMTPAQKDQYESAVAATKRMLFQMTMAGLQAKQRLAEELAKPRPDFSVLEETRRAIVEDGRPLRREARDEWRKLYAMLDADQVATFRRYLEEQMDQATLLHEFLLQFLTGRERI